MPAPRCGMGEPLSIAPAENVSGFQRSKLRGNFGKLILCALPFSFVTREPDRSHTRAPGGSVSPQFYTTRVG